MKDQECGGENYAGESDQGASAGITTAKDEGTILSVIQAGTRGQRGGGRERGGNALQGLQLCMRERGPSTPRNDSLRESFRSAQDDNVMRRMTKFKRRRRLWSLLQMASARDAPPR
jgi:hypothetical protein